MPYAPGIQDISGQLLAQGMSQAGAARARSIESIGESLSNGIKQYQQNESFTQQSLAKFTERMQDPEFNKYVNNILADDSNTMGVPESVKTAFRNAQTGKLKPNEASTLATIAQDYSERQMASAKAKQINLQNQNLQAEIDQRLKLSKMFEDMQKNNNPALNIPAKPAITNEQASNASQFLPGASAFSVTPSVAPQAPPNRFRRVSDAPMAVSPVAPPAAALEAFMPPQAAKQMPSAPMVNVAVPGQIEAGNINLKNRPIIKNDDGTVSTVRSISVGFGDKTYLLPTAINGQIVSDQDAINHFQNTGQHLGVFKDESTADSYAKKLSDQQGVMTAQSVVAPAQRLIDPEALQAARQRFDTGISSQPEQFTLPQIKLSPEAKDIARRLREQYDDSSAVLERRAATPRLTASEDEGKAGSLKKKKTITLDEEGIKAILSDPRILVESFGDVMGDPYERAMRNQATDAAFRRNAQMRELERQFGVRTPARRGK